jgi:high-affinity iron transporter
MLSAFLIALREGLEAALIVGIVLGYLRSTGRQDRIPMAWSGVVIAALLSAALAIGMRVVGAELSEPFEQMFEGTAMLLAVLVLTWMIFWMRSQGRFIKGHLEHQLDATFTRGENWGLFTLAFLAVFREGLETALFLAANAFAADGASTLVGALAGLALAVLIGVLIYQYSVRLNLSLFFDVTSLLLIVFAAGMVAHGVHEYQEIGWLGVLTNPAWDTKALLNSESGLGALLNSLIGYNDQPSMLEVVTYVGYWAIILQTVRWWSQRLSKRFAQGSA